MERNIMSYPEKVIEIRQFHRENYGQEFPDNMPMDEDTLMKAESIYDILTQNFHQCGFQPDVCEKCLEAKYGCRISQNAEDKETALWLEAVSLARCGVTDKNLIINAVMLGADLARTMIFK